MSQYLGKKLAQIYSGWGKRTAVSLFLDGREWTVETLRNRRQCRFSVGWDDFVRDIDVMMDEVLSFQYMGNFKFEVTKV